MYVESYSVKSCDLSRYRLKGSCMKVACVKSDMCESCQLCCVVKSVTTYDESVVFESLALSRCRPKDVESVTS